MDNLNTLLANTGVITTQDATADLLSRFGLNWTVSKQPLNLPSGKPTGFVGIVRDDAEYTFATAREGYEIFQNSELLDLVNTSAGKIGLSIDNGGLFKKGGLVYLQLSSGSIKGIGKNNDTVKKYISAMNSHDGTMSLKWGVTNVTISCMNSFWRAVGQMQNSVKHTIAMRNRIEETTKQILGVLDAEKSLYDTLYRFADAQATKQNIVDVNKMVLGVDIMGKTEDMTTYQINRLKDLSSAITSEMNEKGETLFGLFNGVTKYTTHLMSGTDLSRTQSKAIGSGYNVDNRVFNYMEEIVL